MMPNVIQIFFNNRFRRRVNHILFDTAIDFLQLTLGVLYLFCAYIMFHLIIKGVDGMYQKEFNFLGEYLPPIAWAFFLLFLGFFTCWDILIPLKNFGQLRFVYMLGACFWMFIGVGIYMRVGPVITIGLYAYAMFHSAWLYVRYSRLKMLKG